MKIKSLTIYGFGKWVNKTFLFDEDFIAFCGNNEAGKSTIQQFIHFVLFGFPKGKRKKDVNFYIPKDADKMGGKIVVSTQSYAHLTIERVLKGRSSFTVNIFDDNGKPLPETVLNDVLKHVPLDVYQQFFSITLNQLQLLKSISKDELNRYFLTLSTSGNDDLFFWYDEWQKQVDKLYRPKGEKLPLNQTLETFHVQNEKYNTLIHKQESYTLVQQQIDEATQQLEHSNENLKQLAIEKNHLDKLLKLYPIYQQYTELPNADSVSVLPVDIDQLYDTHQTKKDVLNKQLTIEKERLEYVDSAVSAELMWFRENAQQFKQALNQLPTVEKVLQDIATIDFKRDYLTDDIAQQLEPYAINSYKKLPETYNITPQAQTLLSQENNLFQKQQQLNDTFEQQKKYQSVLQNEKESILRQKQQISVPRQQSKPINLVMICAILLTINVSFSVSGILSNMASSILFSGLALLIGMSVGVLSYIVFKNKKIHEQQSLRLKIQLLNDQLEHFNLKISDVQNELLQIENEKNSVATDLQHVQERMNHYKVEQGIPDELTLAQYASENIKQVYNNLTSLKQLNQQKENSMQKLHDVMRYYTFFQEKYNGYDSRDDLKQARQMITSFKVFVDDMRILDAQMLEKEQSEQEKRRNIQQIEHQLHQLQEQEDQWLNQANVTSLSAFEHYLAQQKQYRYNAQKKSLLFEQLKDDMSTLKAIDSIDVLSERIETVNTMYEEETTQQQHLLATLAKYKQDKLAIEQDGSVLDMQFELAQTEETIRSLIVEIGSYMVSMKMVEMMLSNGRQHVMTDLVKHTSVLFAQLTNDNYNKVIFHDDKLKVIRHDEQPFELFELSQGTIDQLYVALRLAFIQLISDDINLPIIIDDCFVNFDDIRRANMFNILKEMAKTHQVIYMTYNNEINQHNISVIQLNN